MVIEKPSPHASGHILGPAFCGHQQPSVGASLGLMLAPCVERLSRGGLFRQFSPRSVASKR